MTAQQGSGPGAAAGASPARQSVLRVAGSVDVTVQTPNELIVLEKGDIESRQHSPLSMMPEGQLDPLTMDQVRDLIGYLASPVQVPLPAGKK